MQPIMCTLHIGPGGLSLLTITMIGNRLQLVDTSGDGGGLAWKIGDVWPEKAMEDNINAVVEFCDEFYDREKA